MVPGGVTYDGQYFAVKLDPTHLGTDVEVYIEQLIGKRIKGETSQITAKVVDYVTSSNSNEGVPTLFVKYQQCGPSGDFSFFQDSELLLLEEPIIYGNTTLNAGSTFKVVLLLVHQRVFLVVFIL